MHRLFQLFVLFASVTVTVAASSQPIPIIPPAPMTVCPGAFPTDLTATDCSYKLSQRTLDFVSGSVTDQAILGAVVFGLGAQIIQSPSEWKRTWYGYGERVGSRYTQAVGKGSAQFIFGSLLRDDPRPLAYRNEPKVLDRRYRAVRDVAPQGPLVHDGWQRFGHAWFDSITVRRSSANGQGRRIPAFSRFAGEFAGAYAGYPWYPAAENKFPQVAGRVASAFGTAVLSSFYNEYKPEITNLLGAITRQGKQPKPGPGGQP